MNKEGFKRIEMMKPGNKIGDQMIVYCNGKNNLYFNKKSIYDFLKKGKVKYLDFLWNAEARSFCMVPKKCSSHSFFTVSYRPTKDSDGVSKGAFVAIRWFKKVCSIWEWDKPRHFELKIVDGCGIIDLKKVM